MKVLISGASSMIGKKIIEFNDSYLFDTIGRSANSNFCHDLTKPLPLLLNNYEFVIHVAGLAHIQGSTKEIENNYYQTNYQGTLNLLNALEKSEIKYFTFISSVAVYGMQHGLAISENNELLAEDAYGFSKIKAENAIIDWCNKKNVICTILRLPLVIGNEARGSLASMINGISKGYYFNIDGGKAHKSMVLVDDVSKIIFKVAKFGGIFNLTDGIHPTVYELSSHISRMLKKNPPISLPLVIAKIIALVGDIIGDRFPINSNKLEKITSDLTFDDSLARKVFGWSPTSVLQGFTLTTDNK